MKQAYKGYLIVENDLYGEFYVQKDGFTIYTAPSLAAAKAAIDGLQDGAA